MNARMLGGVAIVLVCTVGYLLAGWMGALSGFLGFAVGGFIGARQMTEIAMRIVADRGAEPER
jgi:chromate transport protein ChrA